MRTERHRPFFVGFMDGMGHNGRAPFAVAVVRSLKLALTYRLIPGVRRRRLVRELDEMRMLQDEGGFG